MFFFHSATIQMKKTKRRQRKKHSVIIQISYGEFPLSIIPSWFGRESNINIFRLTKVREEKWNETAFENILITINSDILKWHLATAFSKKRDRILLLCCLIKIPTNARRWSVDENWQPRENLQLCVLHNI